MSDNKKIKKTAGYNKPAMTGKPVMTEEENDLMMNRLMLGFVLAVCAVTAVMMLKNSNNTIQLYETVGPVMSVVCAVLFVLSAVFFGIRTKRGTDDSKKILTRWNVLGAGAVSLFCSVIFFLNPAVACAYAVAMVICACVLYFVYYIYPRVFFTLASVCVAQGFFIHAGFGLSTARAFSSFLQLMSKIGTLVLPIAAIVWFLLAAKKHPKLARGIALWQPVAVCAVALIGALLLWCGSLGIFYFAYHYVLYAIAAAVLAVGVVYTVKSI